MSLETWLAEIEEQENEEGVQKTLDLIKEEDEVPDFSLFFTIINYENPQIDDLKHLSNTIGSGFNIIQKTDNKDTKTPAAHVLNMCSVLCTRLLISAPEVSFGESEGLINSYLKESFIGSRIVKHSDTVILNF